MRRSGRTTRMLLAVVLQACQNEKARLLVIAGNAPWTFNYLMQFIQQIGGHKMLAPMKVEMPNGAVITVVSTDLYHREDYARWRVGFTDTYFDHYQR